MATDSSALMGEILIPVSPGELLDRLSILTIKSERLTDPKKVDRVNAQMTNMLGKVAECFGKKGQDECWQFYSRLKAVNEAIWNAQERLHSVDWSIDSDLAPIARVAHEENDERFRIKREIDALMDSDLVEEKSYL